MGAVLLAAQSVTSPLEFTLFKGRGAVKVGPVDVTLKSTDTNRHRYNFEMVIEGVKIEQKDQYVFIPFYFYAGDARYELLVSKVEKDQITGRLTQLK